MAIDSDKIKITEKALSYLRKKGKESLTISLPDYRTSGDFAVIPIPDIFVKTPKSEEEYNKVNVEGINVYVSRKVYLPTDNDIIIDVDTFLKMNFITMSGFKIEDY